MQVRFTRSAARQLYDEVVRLRSRNREAAAELVLAAGRRLRRLAEDSPDDAELDARRLGELSRRGEHRFFYRRRGDTLWVLAMAPSSSP